MAVKSKADIQTAINALAALVTIADIQSLLTDMNDSYTSGTLLYQCPLTSDLVAGANIRTHSLYINVFNVFVIKSGVVYKPDFTLIDDENISIKWVGATSSAPQVYYLATV